MSIRRRLGVKERFAAAVLCAAVLTPVRCEAAVWHSDFASAWKEAQELRRPLVVHFFAQWCGPCRQMDHMVLGSGDVLAQLENHCVAVKIDADQHRDLVERFHVQSLPTDIFLDPHGTVLSQSVGFQDKTTYLARLGRIEAMHRQNERLRIANRVEDRSAPSPIQQPRLLKPVELPSTVARSQRPFAERGRPARNSVGGTTPPVPLIGLGGYSPVSLKTQRQWRSGRPEYAYTYQGVTFFMADAQELRAFTDNPTAYAPRLLGCDPVILLTSDRAIFGDTRFGAYFDGDLYLFTSDETRQVFKQNAVRYTEIRNVMKIPDLAGIERR